MPKSHFIKRVLEALDELTVTIDYNHKPKYMAIYHEDGARVILYLKKHKSFDEMCVSLLHESCHHILETLPEYVIDEALDRAAFTSPRLRWAAAKKIGTVILKF